MFSQFAMAVNHGLLSRKTVSSLGGTFNEGAADTSMDFGRRMLAKFGWKDGQGLGKKEQGMTSHIRAVQRRDGLGLGGETLDAPSAYAVPAVPADAAPPRTKKGKKRKGDGAAAAPSSSGGSGVLPGLSDEELFELCGGARLGMRARAKQDGKQARMAEADRAFLEKFGKKALPKEPAAGGSGGATSAVAAQAAAAAAAAAAAPAAGKSPKLAAKLRKQLGREPTRAELKAAKAQKKAAKAAAQADVRRSPRIAASGAAEPPALQLQSGDAYMKRKQ